MPASSVMQCPGLYVELVQPSHEPSIFGVHVGVGVSAGVAVGGVLAVGVESGVVFGVGVKIGVVLAVGVEIGVLVREEETELFELLTGELVALRVGTAWVEDCALRLA